MKVTDYREHQNEHKLRSCCCFAHRAPWELQPDRKVSPLSYSQILIGTPDSNVPNNRVETSKYNCFTFLPKNSFEQLSKTSNLYFLLLGIFQILPAVTTTEGQPTVYLPLSFIILVSMVKDFFEDFKRKKADEEENFSEVQRYSMRTGVFEYDLCERVHVGDIVRIANKQRFPADVILLSTSANSECFIETKNLDGETNLKPKYAHPQLHQTFHHLNEKQLPYNLFATMDFERQNPLMYKFKGSFSIIHDKKVYPREFLSYENFIERGCSLQNTDWALAVVVYTGHDTKIMMNSIRSKMKYSNVEIMMGRQIVWVFLVLLIQCIFASIYYNVWYQRRREELQEYLVITADSAEHDQLSNFVLRFAMWFLLLGNSVPISLMVTLETVKFFQAKMIQIDKNYMYENRHATVHSSNLSEELGVIEYIFSDKTGTLTQNVMKFKSLTIGSEKYGRVAQEVDDLDEKMNFAESFIIQSQNVDFTDSRLTQELTQMIANTEKQLYQNEIMYLNMLCLSLCHTVQTESVDHDEIEYKASSPDELALVSFAAEMGFKYLGKDEKFMKLLLKPTKEVLQFQIVQIIEFNSTRKRMSIILRDPSGRLLLFCKGADNILLSMLSSTYDEDLNKRAVLYDTKRQLQEYATVGLRTLVLAYKELDAREFEKFVAEYSRAQSILDDDQLRESVMSQLEETIEQNLTLLGTTAVEDKLQDQVGEVIADLKKAGIHVWVLTGDKIETAINIGYSCKLLNEEIKQFIVDGELEGIVERQLNKILNFLATNKEPIALIVSGPALVMIIHNFKEKFFQIALSANAVMACRVSPKQKQEVVQLVRRMTGKITLSIGDGANDVAMITQAHVGVGIRGLEGQQAAKASDYAIGEFKQLRRLLFYTGHESYRRNSNLILFNFYKNQLFTGIFFFYGFQNGFSAQNLYDQWLSQIFNVFFTSLPIILYALFDEKYPTSDYLQLVMTQPNELEKRPEIYQEYLQKPVFNLKSFWRWFFWGLYQSLLLLYIGFYAFEPGSAYQSGQTSEYFEAGMTLMGTVVYIVNIRVIMLHNTNYPILVYINFGSSLTYILFFLLFSQYEYFESYDLFQRTLSCFNFYAATSLMIALTNFVDTGSIRYQMMGVKSGAKLEQQQASEINCEL